MAKCLDCNGNGICKVCAGVPIRRNPDGTAFECSYCNKTGWCPVCHGSGETSGGGTTDPITDPPAKTISIE